MQVSDGVISARYPLLQYPDEPVIGEVILEGTYAASGESETLHLRYRTARNAQIIGTTTYTPARGHLDNLAGRRLRHDRNHLRGSTYPDQQPGPPAAPPRRDLQRPAAAGQLRHRPLDPVRGHGVRGRCQPSLLVEGYEGSTNLNLDDGSDNQSVQWYDEEGDLAEITSITVSVTENGRRRSVVQATPDGLILEQIQPLTLSYELVLPNEAGTITGGCAAEAVVTRTAVEPVAE